MVCLNSPMGTIDGTAGSLVRRRACRWPTTGMICSLAGLSGMQLSSSTRLFASRLDTETDRKGHLKNALGRYELRNANPSFACHTYVRVAHVYSRTGVSSDRVSKGTTPCSTHTEAPTFPPQPERCFVLDERDVETHTSKRHLKGQKSFALSFSGFHQGGLAAVSDRVVVSRLGIRQQGVGRNPG